MKDEKDTAINTAMANLNKKYGANTIIKMDEKNSINIEAIPTGCFSLDYILACGGLPTGRMIELYGVAGGGKTSLAMYFISQLQKQGKKAMLVDVEFCFSKDYAEQLGINVEELILSQPSTAEQALDVIDEMVRSNAVDIIVLDSVASLVPQAELEGEIGDTSIALQARLMSRALRILTGSIARTKTIVVFINQLRDRIGIFWGQKSITPGGHALKFYSSVRIEVKQGKKIKDGERVIGNEMIISTTKNKVGEPWRSCKLDLIYGGGVDTVADIFDLVVKNKIITKTGNTYVYGETKLASGRDHGVRFLKENPELLKKIKGELYAKEAVVAMDDKKKEEEKNE